MSVHVDHNIWVVGEDTTVGAERVLPDPRASLRRSQRTPSEEVVP